MGISGERIVHRRNLLDNQTFTAYPKSTFTCKPASRKCRISCTSPFSTHFTGWLLLRNSRNQIKIHRWRRQSGQPVCDGAGVVAGTKIEFTVRCRKKGRPEQNCRNSFFVNLKVPFTT